MFTIVDENADFVLVNKSPGISFHTEENVPGLLATVKAQLELEELYPVHRLDKITSGLVLMAKTPSANRALSMAFEARKVEKYYLALSHKKPKKKQGLIKGDMERSRRGSWKLVPTADNPAMTQFYSQSIGGGARLFLLKPLTGKTHQLRVALKSIGASILGDPLYGSAEKAERGYLHAYSLGFSLNGKDYRYCCPPTEGDQFLTEAINRILSESWCRPWELDWPKKNLKVI